MDLFDGDRHEVLVVGGGQAAISLAARLLRDGRRDVAVVAPQPVHRYRPLLNYVGAGEATMADLERPMADVVPDGCTWVRDAVVGVDPAAMTVRTHRGRTLSCSTLVLCPGMAEDWDATPGLRSAYLDGWAASTYLPGSAPHVWSSVRAVTEGSVLFTVPPEPAPSGPTALKPLFAALDHWRRSGVLRRLDVRLVLPEATPVGLPPADEVLERRLASAGVEVLREARVESVRTDLREVVVTGRGGRRVLEDVAFAHVVPHYRAPRWIADSGLATGEPGQLVDIDPTTLRHRRHDAIWALGDAANLATRSSGGALRHQVDILAQNLAAARDGGQLQRYDGYTTIPITVSRRRLTLAEVGRDGRQTPQARLLRLTRPRRATWAFDRYVLPALYWHRILKGKV